jgi:hypothetical protein
MPASASAALNILIHFILKHLLLKEIVPSTTLTTSLSAMNMNLGKPLPIPSTCGGTGLNPLATSLLLRVTDNYTGVTVDDFESVFRTLRSPRSQWCHLQFEGLQVYRRTNFSGLNFQTCLLGNYLRRY